MFFWFVFSGIQSKSPYSVRMRDEKDQKKLRIRSAPVFRKFTNKKLPESLNIFVTNASALKATSKTCSIEIIKTKEKIFDNGMTLERQSWHIDRAFFCCFEHFTARLSNH